MPSGLAIVSVLFFAFPACLSAASLRNVLMITVDDLRPQLGGAYGMVETVTPNLDKFAAGALTFQRAYCQQAVCSPSRNSFMSGRRPDTTKVWNFVNHFREAGVGKNWTSLPQWFKKHGYFTFASGKLYHPAHPPNNDYPKSWTTDPETNPYYWGNGPPIGDAGGCNGNVTLPLKQKWNNNLVCQDTDDNASLNNHDNKTKPQTQQEVEYDHRVATRTIEYMTAAKAAGKNFFVGAGLRRPHLQWRHPTRFWDLYEGKELATAKHQTIGNNITELAFERNGGQGYSGVFEGKAFGESPNHDHGLGPIPQELQQQLRRGYYASVSFMDFEVGRILDALQSLGLEEQTAVLFHADHGWKLGEHGDWSKCTNWELDARVPLLIRAPWMQASVGKRTLAIAELVDLFPTLVELSGLPMPPVSEGLEGTSLVPAMDDPTAPGVKKMAFSQYPRCPEYSMYTDPTKWECLQIPKEKISHMGFSVRTAEARYTEWRLWKPSCVGDWTTAGLVAKELYNHSGDVGLSDAFDGFEYENAAYQPQYEELATKLAALLLQQFNHSGGCGGPTDSAAVFTPDNWVV